MLREAIHVIRLVISDFDSDYPDVVIAVFVICIMQSGRNKIIISKNTDVIKYHTVIWNIPTTTTEYRFFFV